MRHFLAAGVLTLALGMTLPALSVEESVDQKFAADVAKDGMAEVELGRLALNKSDNAKVREFANRMVQDHSKAQMQLEGIAKSGKSSSPASRATSWKWR